jgi:hypothetical protein
MQFTVSDLRLPEPGGPGPCIFIPQEQGGPVIPLGTGYWFDILWLKVNVKVMLRPDGQSASLSWNKAPIWD